MLVTVRVMAAAWCPIVIIVFLLVSFIVTSDNMSGVPISDMKFLEFPLNLEFLEAEFFAWGAFGRGLDTLEPNLSKGGPPPYGARKARLSPLINNIIAEFAYQEFGHLRY